MRVRCPQEAPVHLLCFPSLTDTKRANAKKGGAPDGTAGTSSNSPHGNDFPGSFVRGNDKPDRETDVGVAAHAKEEALPEVV